MKLYFSKGACSLAVRIVAHELDITLDYEAVNLHSGPTKTTASGKDYLSISPKGNVPVLVLDNGEILTENAVIQQYLADTHPSPMLPPLNDFKRYRVLEWLNFMSSDMHKAFSPLFNPNVPAEIKENIFIPIVRMRLETINEGLEGRTYLLGDHFTLPDAYCFVTLRWLASFKISLADYPNVQRYFHEVSERPAVKAALEEERHA
ncbi:MAG: glutathione binding-like protein [Gammaproteobacteria bacterium]